MIVDIPFPYDVTFVRKRHQNSETRQMWGTVPVLVREIASEDAPVAATVSWKTATRRIGDEDPRLDGRAHKDRIEIRCFEGDFWKPLLIEDYTCRKHFAAGADDLATKMVETRNGRNGPTDFGGIEVREIYYSTEDVERAENANIGDRYLLIEGQAFVRTTEPVYKIETGGGFNHYVYIDVAFLDDNASPPNVFRADRLTAALVRAEVVNGAPLESDFLSRRGGDLIEVVDASLLQYRDEELALLHDADYYLGGVDAEDMLKYADMAFLGAYVSLRDAVSGKALEAIVPALQDLMGHFERTGFANYRKSTAEEAIQRHGSADYSLDPELQSLSMG